jgi:hypothetical protein
MGGGSTLTAACEAVGVNRVSGRRWRQATGGRIPRKIPEPSGSRRTIRSIITRLRRALGVPKLPATHGQSRAQAGGHALLNQAVRHGGLPVSSWFPS